MNKIAISIATIAVFITAPAIAADLVRKAPPPPAPVYGWTGFYFGGNVGYGWGHADSDLAGNQQFFVTPPPVITIGALPFANSQSARFGGAIGGAQAGYNVKLNSIWVAGLEADIQASGARGSGIFNNPIAVSCDATTVEGGVLCGIFVANPHSALTQYQAKIDWFGTVRGRVGFLQNDHLLIYATGGIAYGRVGVSGNTTINSVFVVPNQQAGFAASKTNIGFAVGGGMEGRIGGLLSNWTWKLEYIYLDLGSLDTALLFQPTTVVSGTATSAINTHTRFTDNIVRVGLNYQFR